MCMDYLKNLLISFLHFVHMLLELFEKMKKKVLRRFFSESKSVEEIGSVLTRKLLTNILRFNVYILFFVY